MYTDFSHRLHLRNWRQMLVPNIISFRIVGRQAHRWNRLENFDRRYGDVVQKYRSAEKNGNIG